MGKATWKDHLATVILFIIICLEIKLVIYLVNTYWPI